jgi:uncharacterized protein DUF664
MTKAPLPAENISPRLDAPSRADPPLIGDERTMLLGYLEYYRETIALKCAGVPPGRLSERGVPPSGLSLHGMVRHLAAGERWWFRIQFAGEDVPLLYYSDDDPNQDFDDLAGDPAEAFAVWRAECARSREIVAGASLDDTGRRRQTGEPISLRRLLLMSVTEYARHAGHADLLRERVDGVTGE